MKKLLSFFLVFCIMLSGGLAYAQDMPVQEREQVPEEIVFEEDGQCIEVKEIPAGYMDTVRASFAWEEAQTVHPQSTQAQVNAILKFARDNMGSYAWSGYCQAFVKDCYQAAGIYASTNAASAAQACNWWLVSRDLTNIPIGACVYLNPSLNKGLGHVAIYAGNGKLIHTVQDSTGKSKVTENNLQWYINEGTAYGWGYQAGYDLYKDTPSAPVRFEVNNPSGVTNTDATLSATIYKNRAAKVGRCGLYIGTQSNPTHLICDTVNSTLNSDFVKTSFNLNKYYGTLQPGTTYYYRFFIDINGTEYKDTVRSFKTTGTAPDTTKPVISNVKVTNVTNTGYTVSCTVTDNVGVVRVQFPTWTTANGQDDLIADWRTNPACSGTKSGNTYTFRVKDAAHNYQRGVYNTDVYAFDAAGNYATTSVPNAANISNTYNAVKTVTWNNHTYRLYDDLLTWTQAKAKCEALGGHLVTINSAAEQQAIENLLQSCNRNAYFIGGYAVNGQVNARAWVTGEAFSYAKWAKGQPDNYQQRENRYSIYGDTVYNRQHTDIVYHWNDLKDDSLGLGFILEIEQQATGVTLSHTALTLTEGGKAALTATVQPAGAANKTVTWSSSNTAVATVSGGQVTAKKPGSAVITVRTANGKTATCKVTVKAKETLKPQNNIEQFVTRLYQAILGRTPDAAGLAHWASGLANGSLTGTDVAKQIVFSEEYVGKRKNDTAFLSDLYKAFFDRTPDTSGVAYWQDYLTCGISREYVAREFIRSAEFSTICSRYGIQKGVWELTAPRDQNLNITRFVDRMYKLCLSRTSDADGLNYWCDRLLKGNATGISCAIDFVFSPECTAKKLSDQNFIKMLYRAVMGREGDNAGVQYWIDQLQDGANRAYVFNGFAYSPEFKALCKQYGVQLGKSTLDAKGPSGKSQQQVYVVSAQNLFTTKYGFFDIPGGTNYPSIVLRNRSQKQAKNVEIAILHYDSDGYPCHYDKYYSNKFKTIYKDIALNPGKEVTVGARGQCDLHWVVSTAKDYSEKVELYKKCTIRACVVKVEYYDGTTWINPYFQVWKQENGYDTFK